MFALVDETGEYLCLNMGANSPVLHLSPDGSEEILVLGSLLNHRPGLAEVLVGGREEGAEASSSQQVGDSIEV